MFKNTMLLLSTGIRHGITITSKNRSTATVPLYLAVLNGHLDASASLNFATAPVAPSPPCRPAELPNTKLPDVRTLAPAATHAGAVAAFTPPSTFSGASRETYTYGKYARTGRGLWLTLGWHSCVRKNVFGGRQRLRVNWQRRS